MEDKWIDDIRKKMSELEMTPPRGMWDDVLKETNARKNRRKVIIASAIAASVTLIIGFSFILSTENNIHQELPFIPMLTNEHEPHNENKTINTSGQNILVQEIQASTQVKKRHSRHESSAGQIDENADKTVSVSETLVSSLPDYSNESEEITTQEKVGETEDAIYNEDTFSAKEEKYGHAGSNCDSHMSHFSVGVYTSVNGIGGCMNGNDFPDQTFYSPNAYGSAQTRMGGGVLSESPLYGATGSILPRDIDVFNHKLPLRFSISISFHLYRNLNIDTGIGYSYLKSDIRYGEKFSAISEGVQKLHFLGIPIGIRYTPFSTHHIDFYAAGGGMVEKCIFGKLEGNSNSDKPYSYPGCTERPFQFSLYSSVGMQYNIAKECGIYIEPGLGFYIKNGSRLRTIYSERPVTFNLNLGVRFMK